VERAGAMLDVIAGSAFGARSPVNVPSPTFYVHAQLERGATLAIEPEHEERGVYVVEGAVQIDGRNVASGTLALLVPRRDVVVSALEPARLMLIGGAKLEGDRHVYWNFVSSSPERIERAKRDWQAGSFPKVPGDEEEFIPLPE
jgi:redox-sensitive bicupin YhaK (pirin superfamily)